MWPESSSLKAVNFVKKSVTITEIMNFSYGIVFYWRTLYNKSGHRDDKSPVKGAWFCSRDPFFCMHSCGVRKNLHWTP